MKVLVVSDYRIQAKARTAVWSLWLFATLAVAVLAVHLGSVLAYGWAIVDGKCYGLINDDMFISLRYGRNLSLGMGLVYNPGEFVEGFSNPLWTLWGAMVHLGGIPERWIGFALNATNLFLSLALLWVMFKAAVPFGTLASSVTCVAYLLLPSHSYHAYAGMEPYLVGLLLVIGIWEVERLTVSGAVLVGFLPLAHATTFPALCVLVGGVILWNGGTSQQRLLRAGAMLVPMTVWTLFRFCYYGDLVPNTYWLKMGAAGLHDGYDYVRYWWVAVRAVVLLAVIGCIKLWDKRSLLTAGVVGVHVVGVIHCGGDIFSGSRFLFPLSMVLCPMAGVGMAAIGEYLGSYKGTGLRWIAAGVVAVLLIYQGVCTYRRVTWESDANRDEEVFLQRRLALGIATQRSTPPNSVMALMALGLTGYYGQRPVIDMLGKVDRHIARQPADLRWPVGHNRHDFSYVMARKPDFIEVAESDTPTNMRDPGYLERRLSYRWGYTVGIVTNPVFVQEYAPQEVKDRSGRFVPFFARRGMANPPWDVPDVRR